MTNPACRVTTGIFCDCGFNAKSVTYRSVKSKKVYILCGQELVGRSLPRRPNIWAARQRSPTII
jgi:hypothetical protein